MTTYKPHSSVIGLEEYPYGLRYDVFY